ncbi:MAG: hypothetical protein B7X90_01785 [Novosphingobium sp. 17-62-19]|uniref:tail completion protein gp17 n=1 Tax=Novosphingobium sp. 17-62-19 TaxID=1970406 RepID=UPI000BCE1DFB|nr:DUF3168 domain-containing protein [Novosphingobium sp. 17-62-19]OZA21368.1 MAG: hypothetical protein B7X90_01785 [Novosphingobium sp. 17-62-19]HQS95087.1 DUF3168 domain-containing protein [Novosphingobium sp.]
MEEPIRSLLLEASGIAALVGSRIDWGVRPQGDALPAIVLSRTSSVTGMKLSGPSGWTRSRIYVECWGRTYKVARDIADLIGGDDGVLSGLRTTSGGIQLRTFIVGRRADQETDSVGVLHRTALDVMVWHANG